MLLKFSTLKFSNKLPPCLDLPGRYFSIAYANTLQLKPETDPTPPYLDDFEAKIRFLTNNLYPDNLIRVLDNTHDMNSAVKIFKWAALQKRFNHTADTYYHVILKLGLAGNIKEMDHLCLNLARDKCVGTEEGLASLIDSFVRHSKLNEAIRVVVNMTLGGYNPSINIFNDLLGALVKEKKDFQHVLFVYKEMVKVGVLPTVDTLNSLLEVLFETNRVEAGLDQFRRMRKKGCSPNVRTFEIVIKGLILNSRVDDAVLILHEMLEIGCQPDLSFFTCTLPLFCQENRLEDGVHLFRLMRALNLVPDSLICRNLIRCLCMNLLLDDASDILEEMIEIGEIPPVDSFVDIVNGFCEGNRYSEAIHFLENNCGNLSSPHKALLGGFCKTGKFFLGKSLLEKMSERGIADCDSWNIFIRWICENMGIDKAYELLGRMIVQSVVPDCGTYAALVVGTCKLNKYEDALELFYYTHSKLWVLDPICYSRLVEGLCRVEKIKEAVEVYYNMSKSGCLLEVTTFNMLIKALCDVRKVDAAVKLRSLAYCSGTSCTSLTYTTIMLALLKSERAKDVLVMLSQMLIWGCTVNLEAYCILIRSMSALNRFRYCALFFKLMLNEGLLPDSETMHDLLYCLSNHFQLHLVLTDIDKIISRREILDSAIFNLLINGLWKEGCKSEARLLLDLMLERGWVPNATTHTLLIGSNVNKVMTSILTW
ncbi:pentatricopeptide repeat-containing protein At1g63330-like isoform X2 [Durio zibethinus]|uniref:Pentatricopeptide repeat-containing protein At1g63330-like isoform X2 n=1 Tax=Durio zibethinus TaxID=66656 RepID=A0A6P5YXF0_DURZI|nr:pentatricopeptide repeat-containing protein At1g63330-like isoform X2 [Durio zibethinus]